MRLTFFFLTFLLANFLHFFCSLDDCDSSRGAPSPPTVVPNHNNNTIGVVKGDSSVSDLIKSDCSGMGGVSSSTNKPKIWSLADTAACKTPPPPSHLSHPGGTNLNHNYHHLNVLNHHPSSAAAVAHHHHQLQQHANAMVSAAALAQQHPHHHPAHGPPPVTSSWSFALPAYGRSPYGSFLTPSNPNGGGGPDASSNGIGTDTPPQTPPNLKVPLLPGSLSSHFPHHHSNGSSSASSSHLMPSHHHHHHLHPSSGLSSSADLSLSGNNMTTSNNNTAFKPVLKR